MIELPHSKSCFVCGSKNPAGLNLRFHTDGKIVRARFTPERKHGGFVNVIHGGILATVLDEVMVWACSVQTRHFCYCAEMTVRYLSPARAGEELIAESELVENKRGRLFLAAGKLQRVSGEMVASSSGKYMPVKDADLAPWIEDFEGTPEQARQFLPPGFPPATP